MPDRNSIVYRENGLSVYIFSQSKIKSPNLYAKKFDGLFVCNIQDPYIFVNANEILK